MAVFQDKVGRKTPGKKEKRSYRSVPTRRVIENSKKIAKKFKKLDNTTMGPFQAKIG